MAKRKRPVSEIKRIRDPWNRAELVRERAELGGPNVAAALRVFLDDPANIVRGAAAECLVEVADPASLDALVACLEDDYYEVRRRAAFALAKLGDRRATDPLNRCLRRESDGYALAAVIEALGPLGDAASAGPLLARAERYPKRVEEALVEIGPAAVEGLVGGLDDGRRTVRVVAAKALARVADPRAAGPLWRVLKRRRDITLVTAAADGLEKVGWGGKRPSERAQQLVHIARHEWDVLVGQGERPLRRLAQALRHDERAIRCGAAQALGAIGDARVVPDLIRCFKRWKQRDPRTRLAVAAALGRLGDARAVEPLVDFVRSQRRQNQGATGEAEISALTEIGDAAALPPLVEVALDPEFRAHLRRAAADGLTTWNEPRTVEALCALLSDRDLSVRAVAAEGLERLQRVPEGADAQVALLVAGARWAELEARGRELMAALLAAFERETEPVQEVLAGVLGRVGDVRAAESVIDWLFARPTLCATASERTRWIDALSPLFADYAGVIVDAACYARKTTEVIRSDPGILEEAYHYDVAAGTAAVRRLCGNDAAVATNLLTKVAAKPDATVDGSFSENEWWGGVTSTTLSFAEQRALARAALESRSPAIYDPAAYTASGAWRRPD